MAKEGVKFLFGSAIVIGAIALVQYFRRQRKLLSGICVSETSLNWRTTIYNILKGTSNLEGIPLTLSVVNNSNIDVTIKEVDLDVLVNNTVIGYVGIEDSEEFVISKNSESTLELYISLNPETLAQIISNPLLALLDLLVDTNTYKIRGNFVISASVFETLEYPYYLEVTGSELTEKSGDCEVRTS